MWYGPLYHQIVYTPKAYIMAYIMWILHLKM